MIRTIAILLALLPISVAATIINVPSDQPTIQAGVDSASSGDTVLIASGTYTGAGNVDIHPDGKEIVISGMGSSSTILNCQGSSGFICDNWETTQTIIRDLCIDSAASGVWIGTREPEETDPFAVSLLNCRFSHCGNGLAIDGIYEYERTIVTSCAFVGNSIGVSAGSYQDPWFGYLCSISECSFDSNGTAIAGGFSVSGSEFRYNGDCLKIGDRYAGYSASECTFSGNTGTVFQGGGYSGNGAHASNCTIVNNLGQIVDVAGPVEWGHRLSVSSCEIVGNSGGISAFSRGDDYFSLNGCLYANNGGAIDCGGPSGAGTGSGISITGNSIVNNPGDAVIVHAGDDALSLVVQNNLIANNGGIGITADSLNQGLSIGCNDVYGNVGGNYSTTTISDQTGSNGNISEDPYLCDTTVGDYRLRSWSPCLAYNSGCGGMGYTADRCGYLGPVWHVSTSGSDSTGDGSESNPFATIQRGVDAASSGDTVLLHSGVYSGEGNYEIDLGNKSIVTTSQYGPAVTQIDCGGGSTRGFVATSGQDSTAEINGLRIANAGVGVYLFNGSMQLRELQLISCDDGIVCYNSDISIGQCLVSACGLGMSIEQNSTAQIHGTQFISNSSYGIESSGGSILHCDDCDFLDNGGGIYSLMGGSIVTLASCDFIENGGAINAWEVWGETIQAQSCFFDGNTHTFHGDIQATECSISNTGCAVSKMFAHLVRLTDCTVENADTVVVSVYDKEGTRADPPGSWGTFINRTTIRSCGVIGNFAGGADGDEDFLSIDSSYIHNNAGGISGNGCGLQMHNTLYAENDAPVSFYVRLRNSWRTEIIGCSFVSNLGDALSLRDGHDDDSIIVQNTIIAHNADTGFYYEGPDSIITVSCCDLFNNGGGDYTGDLLDPTGSDGNIALDPLFCDTANADYSISEDSPCAADNSPCSTLVGAMPAGCGFTCCTGPSVGNVDGSPDDLVTMGDLTVMIDHLFITLTPLICLDEGNVDLSPDNLVTMGDLTVLIDHLFITLTPLPECP